MPTNFFNNFFPKNILLKRIFATVENRRNICVLIIAQAEIEHENKIRMFSSKIKCCNERKKNFNSVENRTFKLIPEIF